MHNQASQVNSTVFYDNLHGMIDSKIQYLEYKLSLSFNNLRVGSTSKPHSPISSPDVSDELNGMLKNIETLNKRVQKLLFLKSKINLENAEKASKLFYEGQIGELNIEKIENLV